jgi:beta-xylosidase
LQLGWYHVRTPLKREYSLAERPGHLTLYGNGYTINSTESPSMVLRKQTALSGVWSTAVDFNPQAAYEEAGTAVFLSAYSYVSLFIRLSGTGKREVVARWLDEETDAVTVSCVCVAIANTLQEVSRSVDDGTVLLSIRSTPTSYTLAFKQGLDKGQELGTISTSVLNKNRPGILEFTGPHFALFSQSINQPSRTPALFDYASFRPDNP